MAAGIGGKTVSEAKANMSYREARNWLYYVEEKGSLSPATQTRLILDRLEYVTAKQCYIAAIAAGSKTAKIEDFLPERLAKRLNNIEENEENETPASIQDVLKLLKSVSRKK